MCLCVLCVSYVFFFTIAIFLWPVTRPDSGSGGTAGVATGGKHLWMLVIYCTWLLAMYNVSVYLQSMSTMSLYVEFIRLFVCFFVAFLLDTRLCFRHIVAFWPISFIHSLIHLFIHSTLHYTRWWTKWPHGEHTRWKMWEMSFLILCVCVRVIWTCFFI